MILQVPYLSLVLLLPAGGTWRLTRPEAFSLLSWHPTTVNGGRARRRRPPWWALAGVLVKIRANLHEGVSGGECHLRTREVVGSITSAHVLVPVLGGDQTPHTVRLASVR